MNSARQISFVSRYCSYCEEDYSGLVVHCISPVLFERADTVHWTITVMCANCCNYEEAEKSLQNFSIFTSEA